MSRSATVLLLVAAVLAVAARVWFWDSTRLTLEDAFITFRYADNISAGKGFVYNQGEHVLGTTTPLWTLVLAAARSAGATDPVASSRTAGIMCDIATLALLAFVFRKKGDFLFIATAMMVAVSPGVVTMSVSGMETPLLLLLMTAALAGHERRNDMTGIASFADRNGMDLRGYLLVKRFNRRQPPKPKNDQLDAQHKLVFCHVLTKTISSQPAGWPPTQHPANGRLGPAPER